MPNSAVLDTIVIGRDTGFHVLVSAYELLPRRREPITQTAGKVICPARAKSAQHRIRSAITKTQ